jgi:hypothetical protein
MRNAPLFRSVNTQTHGVKHNIGGNFRADRQSKVVSELEPTHGSMSGKTRRGRDYTPLFRFLLSKVGQRWENVFAEAKARLDTTEPIFWLVAQVQPEGQDFVRTGESSYFSGMYIDAEHRLRLVNPALRPEDMIPTCTCCTHTLNGIRFSQVAAGANANHSVEAPGAA